MKKMKLSVATLTLGVGMLLMSSCIGSFSLSGKILKWNEKASNNNIINELIFLGLCIFPMYEVSLLLDALLFNSLEFWTGKSPIANVDTTINGKNGSYHVKSNENGYHIELLGTHQSADLIFDQLTKTWSLKENGESFKLVQFIDDNANIFFGDKTMKVNLNNTVHLVASR
ncbi:MAG: DUF3332 domain-containing protein [Bacteroidales bacterium]